jgi:hypothetical protein
MSYRWNRLAVVALLSAPAFPAGHCVAQPPPGAAGLPESVKWNLDRLQQEPFKLIKTTTDLATGQVRFLIEFSRKPELGELFDWEHRGGPVVFRFLDDEGVVMRTAKTRLEGELVAEKGARIRLLLQLPERVILDHTRAVTAN